MVDYINTSQPAMTDETFRLLRDFIYEHSGIFFPDNKKAQLENRLALRIRANGLQDFDKYYYLLRYDPDASRELKALFDSVTTNETSFFRSPPQFQAFQEKALPEIIESRTGIGDLSLRIWSAGCSTGDEPYSLAMVVREVLGEKIGGWDVKIVASDISEKALKTARTAVYSEYTLRSVPPEIRRKYFIQEGQQYRVTDEIRALVELEYLNFNDEKRVKLMRGFDVIFCRNVLIYFDDAVKKRFVSQVYDNLNPGGYLFIGHSESLHNISRAFKLVHFPGALGYKKE